MHILTSGMEVEVLVMKNPFVLASELDLGTPLLAKTNVGTMDPLSHPFGSSKITSYRVHRSRNKLPHPINIS